MNTLLVIDVDLARVVLLESPMNHLKCESVLSPSENRTVIRPNCSVHLASLTRRIRTRGHIVWVSKGRIIHSLS